MTYRRCIYKNCKSDQRIIGKESGITFFQFPKDPQRRKLWMDLAGVSLCTRESRLLLCSKHFDRKFLSVNNRRTVLVGPAAPYPCVIKTQSEIPITSENVTQTCIKREDIEQINNTTQSDEHFEIVSIEEPSDSTVNTSLATQEYIDDQNVSSFLYNGVMYVKMKLNYYKSEKQALLNKIKEYEQIIDNIRNEVQKIDVAKKS